MDNKKLIDRREFMLKALSASALVAVGSGVFIPRQSQAARPSKLVGRSIFKLRGQVWVNGKKASINTPIRSMDSVRTGSNSRVSFAVGGDAFLLRSNTHLQMKARKSTGSLGLLRLLSGKFLGVYGKGPLRAIKTTTATIGIRGTGVYVEADEKQSYVCTCYGETDVYTADEKTKEVVKSKHHDQPLYVIKDEQGERIEAAPFINHTDEELELLEALVGRTPEYAFPKRGFGSKRGGY